MNIMEQGQFRVRQTRGKAASYCSNTVRVQFRPVNHRTVTPAALVNTVLHVVFLRSYKQMTGSHARWIVAFVQNLLTASQHHAVMQFVRKAVGQLLELARSCKDSVPFIIGSGGPYPTPLLLVNSLPKQDISGLDQRDGIAGRATELSVRLTASLQAWLVSQGVSLLQGLALVRPARLYPQSFGPFCILAPIKGAIYGKQ